jgi:hypothetical protein
VINLIKPEQQDAYNVLIAERKRLDDIVFDAFALQSKDFVPNCPIREHRERIEKRINEFYKYQLKEKP